VIFTDITSAAKPSQVATESPGRTAGWLGSAGRLRTTAAAHGSALGEEVKREYVQTLRLLGGRGMELLMRRNKILTAKMFTRKETQTNVRTGKRNGWQGLTMRS